MSLGESIGESSRLSVSRLLCVCILVCVSLVFGVAVCGSARLVVLCIGMVRVVWVRVVCVSDRGCICTRLFTPLVSMLCLCYGLYVRVVA